MPDRGMHGCPGRCGRQVNNRLFCCAQDWYRLSAAARAGIGRTASQSMFSVERRAAIEAALAEWGLDR